MFYQRNAQVLTEAGKIDAFVISKGIDQVLAFADNTTWISNSKNQIEKIMELAESFYFLNSIEINNKKSKLVVLNTEEKRQENFLLLNHTKIFANNKNSVTRILGVWINTQLKEIQLISFKQQDF
ncbi:7489_t:CDS:2 [Gigaspora margarita]|uniref:7489_t:CDS:1 n=1 Tax=Gigaspora margarita TaxID=4874 RepID=A0ABN7VUY6_GIGMA|nr:7489_t:CDS:2 [Gigaspora margarita]